LLTLNLITGLWGVYTIQQTSSKLPANVFKIHVLMLDHVNTLLLRIEHYAVCSR